MSTNPGAHDGAHGITGGHPVPVHVPPNPMHSPPLLVVRQHPVLDALSPVKPGGQCAHPPPKKDSGGGAPTAAFEAPHYSRLGSQGVHEAGLSSEQQRVPSGYAVSPDAHG